MTIRDVVRGRYELYLFLFLYIYSSMWTCLVSSCKVTTAETLSSDGHFLFISDGQAARHWYAVTGTQLLVTGKLPVTSMYSSDRRNKRCTSLVMIKGPKTYSFVVTGPLSCPSLAFILVIKK
jgi:hypothetical protein